MFYLRQYRTKIVVQTRSQLFRQIVRNDAGILAYLVVLDKYDGKDASVCTAKRAARYCLNWLRWGYGFQREPFLSYCLIFLKKSQKTKNNFVSAKILRKYDNDIKNLDYFQINVYNV